MAIAPAVAGALDAKTIELIGIALDASCTHMYAPGVRRHIQRALKAGATKDEITAVLQLASLQGLHSMCLGAPILLEELEARRIAKPDSRPNPDPQRKRHELSRRIAVPRKPGEAGHHRRAVRARVGAFGLS